MKGWNYLLKEPFWCRQVLAAHYVKDCRFVIEVGSYKSPISDFLHGPHEHVICIDPLLKRGAWAYVKRGGRLITKTLTYPESEFQDTRLDHVPDGFGLVALGVEIKLEHIDAFVDLARRSSITVVECWADFPLYHAVVRRLLEDSGKVIATRLVIDLSGNELGDLGDSHPPRFKREMLVFK